MTPILARITDPSASKAVVGWLQGRSENAGPLIHDYIRQRMLGNPFTSAWATALDPAVQFKNEKNRKAIREALDAYREGRKRFLGNSNQEFKTLPNTFESPAE